MEKSNIVKTDAAERYIDEDGFMIVRILDKSDIDEKNVEEGIKAGEKLSNGKAYYTIIDVRDINLGHVTMKAFSSNAKSDLVKNKLAEAVVLNSIGIRLLANFYIKTFKPKVPTKIFTNLEDAKKWLREIRKKNSINNLTN